MSRCLLELRGLTAGYGAQYVVKDIDLAVHQGATTAIIGPNGHGKSTILRAISGLLVNRTGSIKLDGTDLTAMRPDQVVAAGVVHIPQGDLVFPEMSVLDNLLMGAYLPEAAASAHERLEEVYALLPRLKERAHQWASTLSGGERRMLAIGRGLMTGGRILMVDEPSLGLAPIVIEQIYEILEELRAAGRTIVLVEENPARAMEIADDIHLLDDGSFVWSGTPRSLEGNPDVLETYVGT
ncbi:MAG TPA: ABC transporter ATP-binding protein [Arenicellales bacterium]|nr:ABC transporter ATP-binding protein [Arenicellales bacterium]